MAITSVGQANSAFYTDTGIDPNTAGSFLSFDPKTGQYVESTYQEMVQQMEEDFTNTNALPTTIGDVMKFGSMEGTSALSKDVQRTSGVAGSVHHAATGFSTAMSIKDVLATASSMDPVSLGLAGYETYSGLTAGMSRAETFARAQSGNATVADMLSAYNEEPSWTDYAKNAIGLGLSAFTGNIPGAVQAGLNLASNISAEFESAAALQSAGALERNVAATGGTTFGGFGFVNTAANFQAQQAANLAAASTENRSPTTATIADVMAGASFSTSFAKNRTGGFDTVSASRDESGDVVSRTDFSGGGSFSQNISENERTAARREEQGYQPSTSAERRGLNTTREMAAPNDLSGYSGGSSSDGGGFGAGGISHGDPGSVGHGGGIGL